MNTNDNRRDAGEEVAGSGSDESTNPEQLPGHTSLTTEQRPSETHNTVSSPEGDSAGENKVWTSLSDE
jgi:hypothetical protein